MILSPVQLREGMGFFRGSRACVGRALVVKIVATLPGPQKRGTGGTHGYQQGYCSVYW